MIVMHECAKYHFGAIGSFPSTICILMIIYFQSLRIHFVVKNANLLMKPVASPVGHDVGEVDEAIVWILVL